MLIMACCFVVVMAVHISHVLRHTHVQVMVQQWSLGLGYQMKIWSLYNFIQPVISIGLVSCDSCPAFYNLFIKNCFSFLGIYGAGCLITEGSRGEGGYLVNSEVHTICILLFYNDLQNVCL